MKYTSKTSSPTVITIIATYAPQNSEEHSNFVILKDDGHGFSEEILQFDDTAESVHGSFLLAVFTYESVGIIVNSHVYGVPPK